MDGTTRRRWDWRIHAAAGATVALLATCVVMVYRLEEASDVVLLGPITGGQVMVVLTFVTLATTLTYAVTWAVSFIPHRLWWDLVRALTVFLALCVGFVVLALSLLGLAFASSDRFERLDLPEGSAPMLLRLDGSGYGSSPDLMVRDGTLLGWRRVLNVLPSAQEAGEVESFRGEPVLISEGRWAPLTEDRATWCARDLPDTFDLWVELNCRVPSA